MFPESSNQVSYDHLQLACVHAGGGVVADRKTETCEAAKYELQNFIARFALIVTIRCMNAFEKSAMVFETTKVQFILP